MTVPGRPAYFVTSIKLLLHAGCDESTIHSAFYTLQLSTSKRATSAATATTATAAAAASTRANLSLQRLGDRSAFGFVKGYNHQQFDSGYPQDD